MMWGESLGVIDVHKYWANWHIVPLRSSCYALQQGGLVEPTTFDIYGFQLENNTSYCGNMNKVFYFL